MHRQKNTTRTKLTRRHALQALAAAGVAVGCGIKNATAEPKPNEKLNLAFIGVGGRGYANLDALSSQNVVALVDVDDKRAGKAFDRFANSKRFVDYRKMFDELGSDLDGVVISTPDHTHFHPAYAAMQLGINVYLEKPLGHNVWETRTLTDFARKQKLATQLGTQRHALSNVHRTVELIHSGAIGKVSEVYCWIGGDRGMPDIPSDKPAVPSGLDYDLWLGPVAGRDYHPSICPYGWRFWWDFGTGETGNWGCHILDIPFWALGLRYPNRIDASGPTVDSERTPKSMQTVMKFPESNQGTPITLHWGHGEPDVLAKKKVPAKGANTLFIGDKGMLVTGFEQLALLPEDKFSQFTAPEPTIPDSPGFHNEWIAACKGEEAATCNFDYSGALAEIPLLGNVAYRAGGFDWDYKSLSTGDNSNAQALIREEYKPGWEF